jgi:phosphatidylglycerol:prolipoprotein diacylglycerol transferase
MGFPHGLVPTPEGVRVHPTPIYELIVALFIAWVLWHRSRPEAAKPAGEITGEYLILTGIARFLVEFIRINPKIYWSMSNAQVASIGSILAGIALVVWSLRAAKPVLLPRPVAVGQAK